jgi:hypothetical protein
MSGGPGRARSRCRAGRDAGSEVLDHHVAAFGHQQGELDALGLPEIDRREPLAGVLAGEQHGDAALPSPRGAKNVTLG